MKQTPIPRKDNNSGRPNAGARRKARHYAVQALYQWDMAGASLNAIEAEFLVDNDMKHVDVEYFRDILRGVPNDLSQLDEMLAPCLSRDMKEVTPVERAILRLGAYELAHRIDVPYRVVINESVELSKKFGATESHKFINGALDKLAQQVRVVEIKN
ncbi:transcription antitermination factor NusB [Bermanella sp. R86510]|uniref:transcription antitermination factor NusB n=1 Tax=unclassified Bermanella TaxID=2627862 RepID=UPI0037CC7B82